MLVLKIETMTSATDSLSRAEVETAVRHWIDRCVGRRDVRRAETRGVDFFSCEEIEKMGREEAVERDGLLSFASNMFVPEDEIKRRTEVVSSSSPMKTPSFVWSALSCSNRAMSGPSSGPAI